MPPPRYSHALRIPNQVKLLLRFMADASLSAGAWFFLPPAQPATPSGTSSHEGCGAGGGGTEAQVASGPGLSQGAQPGAGYTPVPPELRLSGCDLEVRT